jgi:signal transduction histidine kinase
VKKVLRDLADEVEASGARVVVGDLPSVEGDPSRLQQLFHNLLGNALKFRRPDEAPRVSIDWERREEALDEPVHEIRVRDRGIGFEPEHAERIFSMFTRLHGRDRYEGTGLGLALCRRIAEQHGGRLSAEGVPGRGATFLLTLPAGPGRPSGKT